MRFSAGQMESPNLWGKPDRDGAVRPFDDRALDHTGLLVHQVLSSGPINHSGLDSGVELAPGGALAVQQLFPAHGLGPAPQVGRAGASLLEIDEVVRNTLIGKPGAGALDGVAVRNAMQAQS